MFFVRCVTCAKNLGEALMSLGREKEAEKLFAFALELTPKDVDALFNLGAPFQITNLE